MRRAIQIVSLTMATTLLLAILLATGCAAPSGGATEEVNWKWNSLQPKDVNWIARVEEGAFQEVSARTNGKFTIDFYGSSALGVDPPSLIQAVGDGLLDCSEMFGVHVLGEWPVSSLLDYPGVLPWDAEMKQEIAAAIFPILEESLAERNIVLWFADFVEPRNVYTVDRADSLSDFKGMKIRAAGTSDVVQAEGIGATAVPTPYSEVYTALERGILDGHITTNDATWTLGFHELEGYMYETHLGGVHTYGIINKDRWDDLPSEYQQVLRDVAKEYIAPTWLAEIQGAIDHGRDEILSSGVVHMNDENPEVVEEMRVATAANCEGPLLEMLAKAGPEGEEAMKLARQIVEDNGYVWRFPNIGK